MAGPNADDVADALMRMAQGEITLDDQPADAGAFGDTLIGAPGSQQPAGSIDPLEAVTDPVFAPSTPPDAAREVRPATPTRRPATPPAQSSPPTPSAPPAQPPLAIAPPPMPPASPVAEAGQHTRAVRHDPARAAVISQAVPAAGSFAPDPDADLSALAQAGGAFQPTYTASTGSRTTRQAVYQSDEFRRTLIPVLGVSGVLLLVLAVSCYCVRPESPLTGLPPWMPPVLMVAGVLLLVLTGLNMASVRASQQRRAAR